MKRLNRIARRIKFADKQYSYENLNTYGKDRAIIEVHNFLVNHMDYISDELNKIKSDARKAYYRKGCTNVDILINKNFIPILKSCIYKYNHKDYELNLNNEFEIEVQLNNFDLSSDYYEWNWLIFTDDCYDNTKLNKYIESDIANTLNHITMELYNKNQFNTENIIIKYIKDNNIKFKENGEIIM